MHGPAGAPLPCAGDGTVRPLGDDRCALSAGSWSWRALAASFGRSAAPMEVGGAPELVDAFAVLAERYRSTVAVSG